MTRRGRREMIAVEKYSLRNGSRMIGRMRLDGWCNETRSWMGCAEGGRVEVDKGAGQLEQASFRPRSCEEARGRTRRGAGEEERRRGGGARSRDLKGTGLASLNLESTVDWTPLMSRLAVQGRGHDVQYTEDGDSPLGGEF